MILVAVLMCMASCQSQFALVYNVCVNGDADGVVNVQFPQGYLAMNGTAGLQLQAGDTVPLNATTTKADVLNSGKKKQVNALKDVNTFVQDEFNATAASGTYDLLIQGTVTETATGLTFSVNKRLTNRADSTFKAPTRQAFDAYPFVQ